MGDVVECRYMNKILANIVKRAEKWPKERQEELAYFVTQVERQLKGYVYRATPEELSARAKGLKGKVANKRRVDAVFAKFKQGKKKLKPLPKWLQASLKDVEEGRVSGPFNTVEELMAHLQK